jgi:hypothetical protein
MHTHTHTNIHTYIHTYTHTHIHTYTHTHIHTYTHTHIHTHIHTYQAPVKQQRVCLHIPPCLWSEADPRYSTHALPYVSQGPLPTLVLNSCHAYSRTRVNECGHKTTPRASTFQMKCDVSVTCESLLTQIDHSMHVQLLTHSHTHSHTHTLAHSQTHTLTHSHTHTLTHSHTHTLTHSHTHTLTHSHIHTLTHSHTHTHTHTHSHTHTHTHTHSLTHLLATGCHHRHPSNVLTCYPQVLLHKHHITHSLLALLEVIFLLLV